MDQWLNNDLLISMAFAGLALLALRALPRFLAGVPFVAPKDVQEQMDQKADMLIIDVRTPAEFSGKNGHIPGALNLPLNDVGKRLEGIRADLEDYVDTPVYVYCQTSNRSASAARSLKKAGLKQVRVIAGGMGRWVRDGLPSSTR